MSLNSSRMPASLSASSQASAFSLVTIGKMISGGASCKSMHEVATQGAGVAIGAGSTSSTSGGANIEGDADNPIAKELVNLFALLVDKSGGTSLVLFVGVALATEVAPEGG